MDPRLERRECCKCHDWFTIAKLDYQKICYNCDIEEEALRS